MKTHELRNLTAAEQAAKLVELTAEYRGVREAVRAGKEKNHGRLRYLRRTIARLTTVSREQVAETPVAPQP